MWVLAAYRALSLLSCMFGVRTVLRCTGAYLRTTVFVFCFEAPTVRSVLCNLIQMAATIFLLCCSGKIKKKKFHSKPRFNSCVGTCMYRTSRFPLALPPLLLQNGPNWLLIRSLQDLIYNMRLTRRYHRLSLPRWFVMQLQLFQLLIRSRDVTSLTLWQHCYNLKRPRHCPATDYLNLTEFRGLVTSPRSFVVPHYVFLCQHSWRVLRSLEF